MRVLPIIILCFCLCKKMINGKPDGTDGFEDCQNEDCVCPEEKVPCEIHGEIEDYKGCIWKENMEKCCPNNIDYFYILHAFSDTCALISEAITGLGSFRSNLQNIATCPPIRPACKTRENYNLRIVNKFICKSDTSQCNGKCARNRKWCEKLSKCIAEKDWASKTCEDNNSLDDSTNNEDSEVIKDENVSDSNVDIGLIVGITFGTIMLIVTVSIVGYKIFKYRKEGKVETVDYNPDYEYGEPGDTIEIIDFNPYYDEPEEEGQGRADIVDFNPTYGRMSDTDQSGG